MARKPMMAGNWKMNKTVDEAVLLVNQLEREINDFNNVDRVVCPPFVALEAVSKALRYSNDDVEAVVELVALHLRFHTYSMGWTDSAVRRYVRDAGPYLQELNVLTRCDCTTRNERKALQLFLSLLSPDMPKLPLIFQQSVMEG